MIMVNDMVLYWMKLSDNLFLMIIDYCKNTFSDYIFNHFHFIVDPPEWKTRTWNDRIKGTTIQSKDTKCSGEINLISEFVYQEV